MANLNELEGTIILSYKTEELLKLFGLPSAEDISEDISQQDLPTTPILEHRYLDIEQDDEGNYLDKNGVILTEEAIEAIEQADRDALYMGTEAKALKRLYEALAETIETFSGLKYEYHAMGDDGEVLMQGTASGVSYVDATYETTEIKVNADIVHLINDCIAGYGQFSVDFELEGESIEDYIKSRFHWLTYYWEIYGDHKPKVDFDGIEDFDRQIFKESIQDVNRTFNIKVASNEKTAERKEALEVYKKNKKYFVKSKKGRPMGGPYDTEDEAKKRIQQIIFFMKSTGGKGKKSSAMRIEATALRAFSYDKVMADNPTLLGERVNQLKQKISLYEHPRFGEDAPIIAVSHDLKLAVSTTFYDMDDFYEGSDYNPVFVDGEGYSYVEYEEMQNKGKKSSVKKESLWKDRLQDVYDSNFEQFLHYDGIYGISERLGFESPEEAWEENPMIQGSTDPADLKIVSKKNAAVLELWQGASNYMGDEFLDYYEGPTISKNSDILEHSNFEAALSQLGGEGGKVKNTEYNPEDKNSEQFIPAVMVAMFTHWMVGWVEKILVHKEAKDKVALLQSIMDALEKYPVLDEELYAEKEQAQYHEFLNDWAREEAIKMLQLTKEEDGSWVNPEGRVVENDSILDFIVLDALHMTGGEIERTSLIEAFEEQAKTPQEIAEDAGQMRLPTLGKRKRSTVEDGEGITDEDVYEEALTTFLNKNFPDLSFDIEWAGEDSGVLRVYTDDYSIDGDIYLSESEGYSIGGFTAYLMTEDDIEDVGEVSLTRGNFEDIKATLQYVLNELTRSEKEGNINLDHTDGKPGGSYEEFRDSLVGSNYRKQR